MKWGKIESVLTLRGAALYQVSVESMCAQRTEVNISETVAFARAAWRRRVQTTDVCVDVKAWLRRQVPFPGCKGTKV